MMMTIAVTRSSDEKRDTFAVAPPPMQKGHYCSNVVPRCKMGHYCCNAVPQFKKRHYYSKAIPYAKRGTIVVMWSPMQKGALLQ